jgi:hypothetical protein
MQVLHITIFTKDGRVSSKPFRPWAVVRKSAWKSNFVATPRGIDFLWFNAQYHRCSITTKSSQAKNLPNTEKMGDQ